MKIKIVLLFLFTLTLRADFNSSIIHVPATEEIFDSFDVNRDNFLYGDEVQATAIYLTPYIAIASGINQNYENYSATLFFYYMKYRNFPTIDELLTFHYYGTNEEIIISRAMLTEFLLSF